MCANGYDEELGSFVQSYGSKWLDGSLLLIPTTGFLPPDDPRIEGTVRASRAGCSETASSCATTRRRSRPASRTARARSSPAASGLRMRDVAGARGGGTRLFERLLACATMSACFRRNTTCAQAARRQFSAGFPHIALINTAHNLARSSKPAEQRAGEAQPGT